MWAPGTFFCFCLLLKRTCARHPRTPHAHNNNPTPHYQSMTLGRILIVVWGLGMRKRFTLGEITRSTLFLFVCFAYYWNALRQPPFATRLPVINLPAPHHHYCWSTIEILSSLVYFRLGYLAKAAMLIAPSVSTYYLVLGGNIDRRIQCRLLVRRRAHAFRRTLRAYHP